MRDSGFPGQRTSICSFPLVPLSSWVRVCPGSTAAPLRGALGRLGALQRCAVSRHSVGAGLLCSARTHPDPCLTSSMQSKHRPGAHRSHSLWLELAAAKGGGCVAECQRRTPKEWSKTAQRCKACDRLRVARRAVAMERGDPRSSPRMERHPTFFTGPKKFGPPGSQAARTSSSASARKWPCSISSCSWASLMVPSSRQPFTRLKKNCSCLGSG